MTDRAHVHGLMVDIGPLIDAIAVTAVDGLDLWTVTLEEAVVFAEYQADDDRLVLWTEVAPVPATNRLAICEQLLRHNQRWPESGRVRMALNQPGGAIVQITELMVTGLDVTTLQQRLGAFVAQAQEWRAVVADQPAETAGSSDLDPRFTDGVVQV